MAEDTLLEIRGVWTDPATQEEIALRTTVHLAPPEATEHDNALVSLSDTSDASPSGWAQRAYFQGMHVKAALDLALRGIDPAADYELEDLDTGQKSPRSGRDLAAGLSVSFARPRESRGFIYTRKG